MKNSVEEMRSLMETVSTLFQSVDEARKNPKQNVKLSVNDEVKKFIDSSPSGKDFGLQHNAFITFTRVKKLGINPDPVAALPFTPNAIYAYPAEYVPSYLARGKQARTDRITTYNLFAGHYPYIYMYSLSGNVLNLSNMYSDQTRKYVAILEKQYNLSDKARKILDKDDINWEDVIYNKEYKTQIAKHLRVEYTEKASLTGVFMWLSTALAATKKDLHVYENGWNMVWRKLGIDAVVDTTGEENLGLGDAIIQKGQATQVAIFNPSIITNINFIENKANRYDDLAKENQEKMLSLLKKYLSIQNPSDKIKFIQSHKNEWYYIPFTIQAIRSEKNHDMAFDLMKLLSKDFTSGNVAEWLIGKKMPEKYFLQAYAIAKTHDKNERIVLDLATARYNKSFVERLFNDMKSSKGKMNYENEIQNHLDKY